MGVFWEYFKKTLRFPLIHTDGPLAALTRGVAGALDTCREDMAEMRTHALPDRCDDNFLNRIASGRGLSRWPGENDALWRFRTETAFRLHMISGRRVCIEEMFELVGARARVVEAGDAVRSWVAAGEKTLDGTWSVGVHALDGTHDLDGTWFLGGAEAWIRPMASVAGMMSLDWAEFGVVMDLGDAVEWERLVRNIVMEFKPARSMPVWGYALELEFEDDMTVDFASVMEKEIDVPRSDSAGVAWHALMTKTTETPRNYIYARIGEPLLRLDRGWVLGKNPMMIMAEGTSYKDFTVNGAWQVAEDNGLVLAEKTVTIIA